MTGSNFTLLSSLLKYFLQLLYFLKHVLLPQNVFHQYFEPCQIILEINRDIFLVKGKSDFFFLSPFQLTE